MSIALLATIVVSPISSGASEVRFQTLDSQQSTPGTLVSGHLYRPDGRGPFPAMALFHGSTGVLPYHHRWAEWLATEGYVALVVDSFTPRGIHNDPGGLTGERVWDINVGGHLLRHDERATADAERRTREFLARYLRAAPSSNSP
jgi:dienelactone hydrolase